MEPKGRRKRPVVLGNYSRNIRTRSMAIESHAMKALRALESKDFQTLHVHLLTIAAYAPQISHLALEMMEDLEPDERSYDI